MNFLTSSSWQLLFAIDPIRAREDPAIVRNVPYYKARKKIETEVMKLEVPPRPPNWGVCFLAILSSLNMN